MAEEDSFVILGSSPLPSLCSHGKSLLTDALDPEEPETKAEEETKSISTTPFASLAPVENSPGAANTSTNEESLPATLPSGQSSLAASFILGDVNAEVLKNSVYSQFPSLCSMQACAEDVVKLQTMMTEYMVLKKTLDKVNHTMQEYYKITQQWRTEAAVRDQEYKKQLQDCQLQIDKLTKENRQLKLEVDSNLEQMRVVEELRQKEHDELRQSASEKSSLIENMRVEMDRLQKHQVSDFEYVPVSGNADLDYVKREEHERQIKDLERKLSSLLAENLEIGEMKKTFIDEIDCLKVNVTSSEELIKSLQANVIQLQAKNMQSDEEITHLKTQVEIYRKDFEMERADREKTAGEKAQYAIDLLAMQRRNQELIEALAASQKNNKSSIASSAASTGSTRSSLRDEQRPVRVLDPTGAAAQTAEYRCPICSKAFGALTVLQSHVNDCLDKN